MSSRFRIDCPVETDCALAVLGLLFKSLLEKVLARDSARFELELKTKSEAAIERLRSDLQLVLKETEFNFSRRGVAFSVFFNKKHESYVAFYDLVTRAHGMVLSLYGFRKTVPIDYMKTEDLLERMHNSGFSVAIISDYKDKIERVGIRSIKEEIDKLFRQVEFREAENACIESKNYLILSKLYFNDELFQTSLNMCHELLFLYNDYEMGFKLPGACDLEKQKQYIENIDRYLEKTVELMKVELSVGYFSPSSDKKKVEEYIEDLNP